MRVYKLVIESYGETLSEDIYVRKSRAIEDAKKWICELKKVSDSDIEVDDGEDFIFFCDKSYKIFKGIYIEVVETSD